MVKDVNFIQALADMSPDWLVDDVGKEDLADIINFLVEGNTKEDLAIMFLGHCSKKKREETIDAALHALDIQRNMEHGD